jgi:hypothetical protein
MEIRDPIHGAIALSRDELKVVDSRPTQRLRRIKQLGFGEFAFPGATHNRFSHSLGAMHLAGVAFDQVFRNKPLGDEAERSRLRSTVRLAALLHDVGHGPLSHASERAMPEAAALRIPGLSAPLRPASHEHYTLKLILDGPLTPLIAQGGVTPRGVAALISQEIAPEPGELEGAGINLRPVLSQLVSSEIDVDRMDYLLRDSYYAGVTYGRYDLPWILSNLTLHEEGGRGFLALERRALHAVEDFLLSRYHMYLMVYFHHLSVIYEEMLLRHFEAEARDFKFPADVGAYLAYDDYTLYTYLAQSGQPLATRVSQNAPYRLLAEEHAAQPPSLEALEARLKEKQILYIRSSSAGTLSHYFRPQTGRRPGSPQIFVVDRGGASPTPLEASTELFARYAAKKVIERVYVPPEQLADARALLPAPR